jgi:tripartite-type tricarboxylate transporter receptor subunit TctC
MKALSRRQAAIGLLALSVAPMSALATDPTYPDRPIKLVVSDAAGGPSDAMARHVAAKLETALRQPVIVDNRPGASGIIATEAVAKAPADGYTLLYTLTDPVVLAPLTHQKLPYDPQKDLAVLAQVQKRVTTLMVSATLPPKTLKDFIALAKAQPRAFAFASWGMGSQAHLAGEYLNKQAGLSMLHVPYKPGAHVTDLASGQIAVAFGPPAQARALAEGGKVRPLAVTGTARSNLLPDVPTFTELGFPALGQLVSWQSIYAPAGTPARIQERLNAELVKIIHSAQTSAFITNEQAGEPAAVGLAESRRLLEEDRVRWQRVVQLLGDIPLN